MTRRRRYSLIATLAVVAALIALVVPRLFAGTEAKPHHPTTDANVDPGVHITEHVGSAVLLRAAQSSTPSPGDPTSLAATEQAFGIALLQRLSTTSSDNLSVSPMSLAIALTMLQNGARGTTLAGIQAALHAGGLDGEELDAGWATLVRGWTKDATTSGFSLQSANSLWLQHGLQTRAAFMSALASYFDTGVWQVDFGKPDATDAINKWTSEQTHGRIPKLFDKLDPSTLAVLANAVYFKAAWQQPFDPDETKPGTFTGPDGSTAKASYMSELAPLQTSVSDSYDAVQLPYQGGRFAALAIMPTRGSLAGYVRGLDATSLQDVVAGLHSTRVQLDVPKFTTTSTLELNDPLKAMGMGAAFGDSADFSALSPAGLKVSRVVQRVFLKVGEKGTEAAAATGIAMEPTSARAMAPQTIRLDHPFLFLIRDTTTGAILFASEINHPTD